MVDLAYYRNLLAPVFAGRAWLVAMDVVVIGGRLAAALAGLGARRSLIVAGSEGTGPLPDPDVAEWLVLGTSGPTSLQGLRAYLAALEDLPGPVQARLDAWDPHRTARVIGTFLATDGTVAGRRWYGARPAAWTALEDKTVVDGLWDEAGIRRAPAEVVPARAAELRAAAARLDRGAGTLWAADNAEGWHGGAEYLRWVRPGADDAEAVAFVEAHARRARVMPFLEGVPCSIHGIVFPDYVVALRPVEMIVFRSPAGGLLRYAGGATTWDPPAADRVSMRDAARRVGGMLRDRVGYRGAFTIDGVMTSEGFLPTELNPRYGAGLGLVTGALADLPFYLLDRAIVAGENLDFRPAQLERFLLTEADTRREAFGGMAVSTTPASTIEQPVRFEGPRAVPAAAGEGQGVVAFGPGPTGGYVRCAIADPPPARRPAAPLLASCFELADRLWDTGIGPLEPARTVPRRAARSGE